MDGRKTHRWQFILFLTVIMVMFVVSVIVLSAKNNVNVLFSPETYEELFGTDTEETDKKPEETDAVTDKAETETEETEETDKAETDETTETTEQETEQTEPPIETDPPSNNTDEPVPPPVQNTDGYIIPPSQRTEPAFNGKISEYAVSQSDRADDSFFDNALFIGDSRTQAIQNSKAFKNSAFFAYQGLNTITAMKSPFVVENDEELMLVDALARHPEYKKIYVCFGINDFWFTESAFREKYSLLIDAIKSAASPDAQIYMYAVAPVLDGMQKSSSGLNNHKMVKFNQIACEIAQSRGVKFVDVSEAFIKEDGFRYLTKNESPDGVHLNHAQVAMICEYLRTHT